MAQYYHVHHNTIRKVIRRARIGDFTIHISTTRANLGYQFKEYAREERRVLRQLDRETSTDRYPYNPPHESLLIGGFFLVFESTESLEKFDIRLETHALYFK